MKTVCAPSISVMAKRKFIIDERKFIIDSILHERLILPYPDAFVFYQRYPKLAKDSIEVTIGKGNKSILNHIDSELDEGFDFATKEKLEPLDEWATHYALGGFSRCIFVGRFLNEGYPQRILQKVREFYGRNTIRTLEEPLSNEELWELAKPIDLRLGMPLLRKVKGDFVVFHGYGEKWYHETYPIEAVAQDLAYAKSYLSSGYAYTPSHYADILPAYVNTFSKISRALSIDIKLSEAFKAKPSEESLDYLLGDKAGELNELLGFTPLNPLELVSKEALNQQVDDVVLKIRKDCKKVRELFEKVHVNCLKTEIDKAVDAKVGLANIKANQLINYSILDNINEFMDRKRQDAVHGFIDNIIKKEMSSKVVGLHRPLKKLGAKFSWISEVKFLTFGTILILASRGVDTSYLKEVFDVLGKASLASGAVGVVLRIIEQGMKLYPGFNVYASFLNWPKIA